MTGINLLGHEENGNGKNREGAGGFELTKPEKAGKQQPPVTREGALSYVRDILDAHRAPKPNTPQSAEAKAKPSAPPVPPNSPPAPAAPSVAPLATPLDPPLPPTLSQARPQPSPRPAPAPPPKPKRSISFFHHDAANTASPTNGINGTSGLGGIDVNLIPEHDDDDFARLKRVRWLVIALLGSLALVGIAYATLVFYESRLIRETNSLDAQISEKQAEIRSFAASRTRASAITKRVTAISKLLDEHPRWTNVFEIVEEYTLPTVYYSSLSATAEGSITLTAFAPDFKGVASQLRVFESHPDVFTSVRIQQAQRTEVSRELTHEDGTVETISVPKVSFGIELTVDPKRLIERNP